MNIYAYGYYILTTRHPGRYLYKHALNKKNTYDMFACLYNGSERDTPLSPSPLLVVYIP